MKFIDLRCPNCNGQLEIENNIDMFFCKYCGTKIILSGQSKTVIQAKEHMYEIDKHNELEILRMKYEQEKADADLRRSKEKDKEDITYLLKYASIWLLILFAWLFYLEILLR